MTDLMSHSWMKDDQVTHEEFVAHYKDIMDAARAEAKREGETRGIDFKKNYRGKRFLP